MELSWSQTPSHVWGALETSGPSSISLQVDDLSTLISPTRTTGKRGGGGGGSLRREDQSSTSFYNYVDEADCKEDKEDLTEWLKGYHTRGVVR